MTCSVCRHPKVMEIDKALLAGEPSRAIAGRYGPSRSAMQRHGDHLPRKLVKAENARQASSATTLVGKVQELEGELRRLAGRAEDSGDLRTAVSALGTGVPRILELLGRLRGELQGAQVNIRVGYQQPLPQEAEARARVLLDGIAQLYRRDPARFLRSVRGRAAEQESEGARVSLHEALAGLVRRETEGGPAELAVAPGEIDCG